MVDRLKKHLPEIVLTLMLTAGWWLTPNQLPSWSGCLIKKFMGFECPGCGLTRSFLSMGRGHLTEAFAFNAAGPLLYVLFVLTLLGLLVESWDRQGRVQAVRRRIQVPFSILIVVLLLGHWVAKLFILS